MIVGMAVARDRGGWQLFLMPMISPQQSSVWGRASMSVRVKPNTPSTTMLFDTVDVTAAEWLWPVDRRQFRRTVFVAVGISQPEVDVDPAVRRPGDLAVVLVVVGVVAVGGEV